MQDNEKINYDNYPLLFDGRLMGYDTETQGFDYLYEMLPYFVTTEIINGNREWSELGKIIDRGYYNYKKPYELLKFFYEAFYPLHLQRATYEPLHNGINVVTLSLVTDYVIKWLAEKMENRAVNNDTESGLVIRGMYETIRPQDVPTPPQAVEEGIQGLTIQNLSHFEIALLYHYRGEIIEYGSSAEKYAKKHGQGSWEELMKQVDLIKNTPLQITQHRFSRRYHENLINNGFLDDCPTGKEKAMNALNRINM